MVSGSAIQEADLLLALGMRFDDRVTGNPARFAVGAKKIGRLCRHQRMAWRSKRITPLLPSTNVIH
jgi:thiamine pyrophosphate-dependent acetolactate synthase large subunit-like protein